MLTGLEYRFRRLYAYRWFSVHTRVVTRKAVEVRVIECAIRDRGASVTAYAHNAETAIDVAISRIDDKLSLKLVKLRKAPA